MIGFYDSGIGGLTIFKELTELVPATALCYFGDTQNCPLGEKTPEEIFAATQAGVNFLLRQGCSLIVLACNTATVISIRRLQKHIKEHHPHANILGIARPVSEALQEAQIGTQTHIALLATRATISSGFYQTELKESGYQHIYDWVGEGLALAIEKQDTKKVEVILHSVLDTPYIQNIEVIVLACTHYPIVKNTIRDIFIKKGGARNVRIISQNECVPLKLIKYLIVHPEYRLCGQGIKIYTTGDPRIFEKRVYTTFKYRVEVEGV